MSKLKILIYLFFVTMLIVSCSSSPNPEYDDETFQNLKNYVIDIQDYVTISLSRVMVWVDDPSDSEKFQKAQKSIEKLNQLRGQYWNDDAEFLNISKKEMKQWGNVKIEGYHYEKEENVSWEISSKKLAEALFGLENQIDSFILKYEETKEDQSENHFEQLVDVMMETEDTVTELLNLFHSNGANIRR